MYLSPQQVEDEFSEPRLRAALDDDGDGNADDGLLARLIASAGEAVDGFLAGRFVVPFEPVPKLVTEATLIFVCEKIYERRRSGPDEKNPYAERATEFRRRLKAIADGEQSLDAKQLPAFTPGAVIQTASALNASTL